MKAWLRMALDFLIVAAYARLLFSLENLNVGAQAARLDQYLFGYLLIFILYLLTGFTRIWEKNDLGASRWKELAISVGYYFILWIVYQFVIQSASATLVNWLFLLLCPIWYVGYRVWRYGPFKPYKKLVVDVDGVIADQITPVLKRLNEKDPDLNMTKDQIRKWDQPIKGPKTSTDIKTEIENSLCDSQFVFNMGLIPGAKEALIELAKKHEIIIATTRPSVSNEATQEWLRENGIPFHRYVNMRLLGKGCVSGDILIDDNPDNIFAFSAKGRHAFLFDQPWNEGDPKIGTASKEGRVVRAHGWEEVVKIIRTL
jgi:5'(3')-deoxyribonucleotidase